MNKTNLLKCISFCIYLACFLYSSCNLQVESKSNKCTSYKVEGDLFLNYKIFQNKKSVDSLNLANWNVDVLEFTSQEDRQKKNADDYKVKFNENNYYLYQEFTNDECSALVSIKMKSMNDRWGSSDFNLLVKSLMKKYKLLRKNNMLIVFSNDKKIIELKNTQVVKEEYYLDYNDHSVWIPEELVNGYEINITEKSHYINQQIKEINDSIERRKNDSLKELNRIKSIENL